jgi:PPOX class probable F420-dependent enzyme
MKVPQSHQDLLSDSTKAFVFLATLMPDGSPQLTPIWFSAQGDKILINSAAGRIKDRNMRRRPQVALCIQDPTNAYRYLQIRGSVTEITTEGAKDHIDSLANKYLGVPKYPYGAPGEQRVKYAISISNVDAHG